MKRLKIYLACPRRIPPRALPNEHDWYLPTKPGSPDGFSGRGRSSGLPPWVHDVPAGLVHDLDLDLILYQTPANYFEDAREILSSRQRSLPGIFLEHNTPRPDAVDTRHPVTGEPLLLVHVTHYNRLMWETARPRRW